MVALHEDVADFLDEKKVEDNLLATPPDTAFDEAARKFEKLFEQEDVVCCYYVCFGLRKYKKCQK